MTLFANNNTIQFVPNPASIHPFI